MTRDRYGIETDGPQTKPGDDQAAPGTDADDAKESRPEDRDDYVQRQPKRDESVPRSPDPSRASNAERYSHQEGSTNRPPKAPLR